MRRGWRGACTLHAAPECSLSLPAFSQGVGVQVATRPHSTSHSVSGQTTNCISLCHLLCLSLNPVTVPSCQCSRSISCSSPHLCRLPCIINQQRSTKRSKPGSPSLCLWCVPFLCHVPCIPRLCCFTPMVGVASAGRGGSPSASPRPL